jgi:hypothetical protein
MMTGATRSLEAALEQGEEGPATEYVPCSQKSQLSNAVGSSSNPSAYPAPPLYLSHLAYLPLGRSVLLPSALTSLSLHRTPEWVPYPGDGSALGLSISAQFSDVSYAALANHMPAPREAQT